MVQVIPHMRNVCEHAAGSEQEKLCHLLYLHLLFAINILVFYKLCTFYLFTPLLPHLKFSRVACSKYRDQSKWFSQHEGMLLLLWTCELKFFFLKCFDCVYIKMPAVDAIQLLGWATSSTEKAQ